jgi:hypothetical protein
MGECTGPSKGIEMKCAFVRGLRFAKDEEFYEAKYEEGN